MPRRLTLACLALTLAIGTARAQVPYGDEAIPSRRALARVNLDLQWAGVVPLDGAEKLTEISIDAGMLFAQTNSANFYAYDAETGRPLWTAHLGRVTTQSQPASVNSTTVFVTNSNRIYALDRRTGRQVWTHELTDIPSSATAADEDHVMVGTESGKLEAFDAKTGNDRVEHPDQRPDHLAAGDRRPGRRLRQRGPQALPLAGSRRPSSSGGSPPAARSSPRWGRTGSGPCWSPRPTRASTPSTSSPARASGPSPPARPSSRSRSSSTTTSTSSTPRAC